jgi:hypothetical protein
MKDIATAIPKTCLTEGKKGNEDFQLITHYFSEEILYDFSPLSFFVSFLAFCS